MGGGSGEGGSLGGGLGVGRMEAGSVPRQNLTMGKSHSQNIEKRPHLAFLGALRESGGKWGYALQKSQIFKIYNLVNI